ncbi:MAG: RT0821/Lpp0805 family surface protein [Gammaproteobacteria bacterium]|jgi:surface antigen
MHQPKQKPAWKPALAPLLALLLAGSAVATPPPWAPAHGYRHKYYDRGYYTDDVPVLLPWQRRGHEVPYISGGHCNREKIGALLGGVIGGAAGSQIGGGSGKTVATVAGTVIGYLVGQSIGRRMDALDQQCTGQTLEHMPDRVPVSWRDPDSGVAYTVTPVSTWRNPDGGYCREYTTRASIGGRSEQLYGQACRQPDGSWKRR